MQEFDALMEIEDVTPQQLEESEAAMTDREFLQASVDLSSGQPETE